MSRLLLAAILLVTPIAAPTVAGTASATAPVPATPPIRFGDSGPTVKAAQEALRRHGYVGVRADGVYGMQTWRAVTHFQDVNGLRVDGIIGPATRRALGMDAKPMPTILYLHPNPNVERWHATAWAAGWPETEWRWLSCVINRESGGNPRAFNPRGSDRSYGLVQINAKAHSRWMRSFAGSEEAFFDPTINLRFAWALFDHGDGRHHWRSRLHPC